MIPSFDPDNITGKYTLDDAGNPVSEPDLMKRAIWMKKELHKKKRVAETHVGRIWISTVFLGLDHRFDRSGPPVLWETMIFIGSRSGGCHRYTSLEEAKIGHAIAVASCKRMCIPLHCAYFYEWVKGKLP